LVYELTEDCKQSIAYWYRQKHRKCYKCGKYGHIALDCENVCTTCLNKHRKGICVFDIQQKLLQTIEYVRIFDEDLKRIGYIFELKNLSVEELEKMKNDLRSEYKKVIDQLGFKRQTPHKVQEEKSSSVVKTIASGWTSVKGSPRWFVELRPTNNFGFSIVQFDNWPAYARWNRAWESLHTNFEKKWKDYVPTIKAYFRARNFSYEEAIKFKPYRNMINEKFGKVSLNFLEIPYAEKTKDIYVKGTNVEESGIKRAKKLKFIKLNVVQTLLNKNKHLINESVADIQQKWYEKFDELQNIEQQLQQKKELFNVKKNDFYNKVEFFNDYKNSFIERKNKWYKDRDYFHEKMQELKRVKRDLRQEKYINNMVRRTLGRAYPKSFK
jgi:ribosomal protein L29